MASLTLVDGGCGSSRLVWSTVPIVDHGIGHVTLNLSGTYRKRPCHEQSVLRS